MRHRFHSLSPYFAMFPETFAEKWIDLLSRPADVVFDPFCGRGTTPFQALLMGRRAVANDINPVAYCITRAKTNAPPVAALRQRITKLERRFIKERHGISQETGDLSEFFSYAYHPMTLRQILFMRRELKWRNSDVDCMLAAITLGALHGESAKSPSYLSNQMARTISTKPNYSVQWWKRTGHVAPQRDLFELLRRLVTYRYVSRPPSERASVRLGDMRELGRDEGLVRTVRLVVTSPPYLDVTNFEEDQWLRLWFLGGPPHPTRKRVSKDDRHENRDNYWRLIADMWRVLGNVLDDKAHVVVRIGGKGISTDDLVEGLVGTSVLAKRRVRLEEAQVSAIRGRQTDAFRPGSRGCLYEVDSHFVIG